MFDPRQRSNAQQTEPRPSGSDPNPASTSGPEARHKNSSARKGRDRLDAFRNVEDFKKVDDFYGAKRIPEDEYFINTLTRQFEIRRDRANTFAEVFRANTNFLRSFNIQTGVAPDRITDRTGAKINTSGPSASNAMPNEGRIREFLDTCFVMTPFGNWFDRYYQEIYVPAIKEAGLEPVRADEPFNHFTLTPPRAHMPAKIPRLRRPKVRPKNAPKTFMIRKKGMPTARAHPRTTWESPRFQPK